MSYKCKKCKKQIKEGMTQFEGGICYPCNEKTKEKRRKLSKSMEKSGASKKQINHYIETGRILNA